jgi:TonB family protein
MRYLVLILFFTFNLSTTLWAQVNLDSLPEYDCIYFVLDDPEFPGGDSARRAFITNNLQYPDTAKMYHVEGVVYASFIVEKDGSLSSFSILRGLGWGCDEEAIRVMKLMPKWRPATRRGEHIRVQMNMPIRFEIEAKDCDIIKPSFPGGKDSLDAFISRNIRYGRLSREEMTGKVIEISLLLNSDGNIIETYFIPGIDGASGIGGGCDEEAMYIINKMPRWIPAKCGKKNIPSSYVLRMHFVGD